MKKLCSPAKRSKPEGRPAAWATAHLAAKARAQGSVETLAVDTGRIIFGVKVFEIKGEVERRRVGERIGRESQTKGVFEGVDQRA